MKRNARPSIPRRHQPRGSRALALLVIALRIFVGLAVFQLSEVGHFGVELAEHVGLVEHVHDADDAREEEPGHDCPPGCPKCHHVHASNASLVPWMTPPAPLAAMLDGILAEFPSIAEAPRGPPLPCLFRPPRRAIAST